MKKAIMEKWVAALESGEYRQTKGTLRKSGAFCCLGILCNLHAQEHPEIASQEKDRGSYLGESDLLPEEVMKWAGMHSSDGTFEADWALAYAKKNKSTGRMREEIPWALTELNDHANYNFKRIAQVIRDKYKEL